MSSTSAKNLDMHRIKSAVKDDSKIVEAETGSIHEVSLVEQAIYQDKNQRHLDEMEFMLEELLKDQLEMTEYMNMHLDFLCKELNENLETLDTRVKMLYTQASQTAEAVRKQEALIKENVVEVERHRVDDILDNGFWEVLEQEKLEEDAFIVESSMSVGSSYWCRPTPPTEHRSTSSLERRPTPSDKHRSKPLLGSDKIVQIQSHSDFAARHPHPPTRARVKLKEFVRQQHERIDRQQQEIINRQQHGCIDQQEQPSTDHPSTPYQVRLPDLDAHRLNATRNPSQTLS